MIGSHIIPKFYLEQFASPSKSGKKRTGLIWVYQSGKKAQLRGTSVQGVENGYFGFVRPDGSLEESFETELAQRENECNDVLVFAKSDLFHWPPGSREKLAFYAALLYSRATQRRQFSVTNYRHSVDQLSAARDDEELLRELSETFSAKIGKSCPQATVQNAINDLIEEALNPASAKNAFLADLLQNTAFIARFLVAKQPWRVLRPSVGLQFVTSDNPLITFVPLGNGKLHPGYGFRKIEAMAGFPLAPNAYLAMGEAWNVPGILDPEMLSELNEAIITISDRYVYSKTYAAQVENQVAQFGGTIRYGKNAFLPIALKMPDVRQFLRMRFGLPRY